MYLPIFLQENSLVESVLIRQVSSFGDLLSGGVKYVRRVRAGSILFTSKDKNFCGGDWTGPKPILDIVLEALRVHLDELPVLRLTSAHGIKPFNVGDLRLITT
jgi:hypothetical protein